MGRGAFRRVLKVSCKACWSYRKRECVITSYSIHYTKLYEKNMTHVFNIKRFGLLLKMELCNSRRGILMTLIITLGFLFFVGLLLNPVFDPNLAVIEHYSGYHFTLFLCGFIFSSLAFRETCDSLHCYRYLTLPVSSFERFFSMWLLTAIGWLVCYTLIFWLYTLFANSAGRLVYPVITSYSIHYTKLYDIK